MCYASALVEIYNLFDQIDMNFLIVGHTHASIDQYFSVLAGAIKDANFIASPLSMHHLVSTAHSNPTMRPMLNKQLEVVYDMDAFFAPFKNKRIKYYSFPHRFRFVRVPNVM